MSEPIDSPADEVLSQKRHVCAIVQSSYIPWRGYFDLIRIADSFIFLDQVQFTKRDWRTRNRILTKAGPQWLRVPVNVRKTFSTKIIDVQIDNSQTWARDHFKTIAHAYSKAKYKEEVLQILEPIYTNPPKYLHQLNRLLCVQLWNLVSGDTPKTFIGDETFKLDNGLDSNGRLVALCKEVSATDYLTGPSANSYLDPKIWKRNNIAVHYANYSYPDYPQVSAPKPSGGAPDSESIFEGAVSIIDVLMNLGPNCLAQALGK